jgi:hypothetical protein
MAAADAAFRLISSAESLGLYVPSDFATTSDFDLAYWIFYGQEKLFC